MPTETTPLNFLVDSFSGKEARKGPHLQGSRNGSQQQAEEHQADAHDEDGYEDLPGVGGEDVACTGAVRQLLLCNAFLARAVTPHSMQ